MLKPSASGLLYIIGEHDHHGATTDLFKIGIVRDNDSARSVEERLREHQTGNPRELDVVHSATTPFVERIETLLHGQHATRRVGGEWFHLPDNTLANVIMTSTSHIATAQVMTPLVEHATELATITSNGEVMTADDHTRHLHAELHATRAQIRLCSTAIDHLTAQLLEAQRADQPRRPWVTIEHKAPRRTFDKTAFASAHPTIYEQYVIEQQTSKKTFRVFTTKNEPAVPLAGSGLPSVIDTHHTYGADSHSGNEIHTAYLQVLEFQAPLIWREEQLDTELRVACADHDGIDGICTWKRATTTTLGFDTERFKHDHPELYDTYTKTGEPVVAHIPAKDRNYRQ